ncbi:MAG: response regulator transcription factor [Mitsuaria chitosanitabida]|uniref:response regulator n=1 Tax=Roseateles chitosanitabidus TaxID=65048 RepID=UPI001B227D60|nr:response regulator transcription factor [Roseateles chitosanitabidus]MBO9688232.1 response regulator transcription factor [Roseateles chitosanitabidus]
MTRLLIVDDHVLVREGLRRLLEHHPTLSVVADAADGNAALALLRTTGVDLVVVDMAMPGLSDVNLITRIRSYHPGVRIAVLTLNHRLAMAQRALNAGADGYLTKDMGAEELTASLVRVASGERVISHLVAEALALQALSPKATHEALSAREQEVLELLATGESVGAIATRLGISHKTVSSHKANLMFKMGFHSVADLVCYALERGLRDTCPSV